MDSKIKIIKLVDKTPLKLGIRSPATDKENDFGTTC